MAYTPPKPEKTESQLEAELQSRMDMTDFADPDGKDVEELDEELETEQADETEDDDKSTPAGTEAADDSEHEDEPTPGSEEGDSTEDKGVEIPDAHIRAAIHQGWTEDDVKELVAMDPDKAKKVLAKLHETNNRITGEFARLGRVEAKRLQDEQKATDEPKDQPDNLDAIKEKYGEDDPLVQLVIKQSQELQESRRQNQQQPQPRQGENPLKQQIDSFFSSDSLKTYNAFYGPGGDPNKWTAEQYQHRHEMLTLVDDIMLGAEMQGRKMDLSEALEKAHMLATKDIQAQVIRDEIAKSVTKRNKSFSLKPKSSKKSTEPSKPKNDQELLQRTEERLKILQ